MVRLLEELKEEARRLQERRGTTAWLAVNGFFFFQAEDGIRDLTVRVQTCALPISGVVVGCLLTRRLPAQKLKAVVAVIAICAGLQLVWSGTRTLVTERTANTTTSIAKVRASQPVGVFSLEIKPGLVAESVMETK